MPVWSTDATRIAFVQPGQPTRVRVVDVDTGVVTSPGDSLRIVESVGWSPDGTRLVVSAEDGVYVLDADGSQRQRIVAQARGEGPAAASWSPDGTRVGYFTTPKVKGGFSAQLRVVDPDGRHDQVLYEAPCCVSDWSPPEWSPDGRFVALSLGILDGQTEKSGLYLVAADGSGATRVRGLLQNPAWQAVS
jgi:Tol biopolymer transport system component